MCSGICTWITSAPQSASWRAEVGPARTCVMSTTRKRASAWEAGMCGIPRLSRIGLLLARGLPYQREGSGLCGVGPLQHPRLFRRQAVARGDQLFEAVVAGGEALLEGGEPGLADGADLRARGDQRAHE